MSEEFSCTSCQSCDGCESCNICQGCDTCEGCVTCNTCNTCEKCDEGCEEPCIIIQTLCKLNGQTYSDNLGYNFAFSYSPTAHTGIMGPGYFDQNIWDEIVTYINNARLKGDMQNTGGTIDYSSVLNVAPFKASEFNRIANEINGLNVSSGDVIYGSYFSSLENAASSSLISVSACDKCNDKCDEECNKCQKCDEGGEDICEKTNMCDACQWCQDCNSCLGCDNCQTGNSICCNCNVGDTDWVPCESGCDGVSDQPDPGCGTCDNCNTCNIGDGEWVPCESECDAISDQPPIDCGETSECTSMGETGWTPCESECDAISNQQ